MLEEAGATDRIYVSDFTSAYASYFGGGTTAIAPTAYRRCAELFLGQLDQRFEALTQALIVGKLLEVRHVAHQLKSGFRMLGAKRLGEIFEEIESADTNLETIGKLMFEAATKKSNFVVKLNQFVEQLK